MQCALWVVRSSGGIRTAAKKLWWWAPSRCSNTSGTCDACHFSPSVLESDAQCKPSAPKQELVWLSTRRNQGQFKLLMSVKQPGFIQLHPRSTSLPILDELPPRATTLSFFPLGDTSMFHTVYGSILFDDMIKRRLDIGQYQHILPSISVNDEGPAHPMGPSAPSIFTPLCLGVMKTCCPVPGGWTQAATCSPAVPAKQKLSHHCVWEQRLQAVNHH